MPDITMCDSEECLAKSYCYRNPASGTEPTEYRQSWFLESPGENTDCSYFWDTPFYVKEDK